VTSNGILDPESNRLSEVVPEDADALPNTAHITPFRGYDRGFIQFGIDECVADIGRNVGRLLSVPSFRRKSINYVRRNPPLLGDPFYLPYTPADQMAHELQTTIGSTEPAFL